MKKIFTSILILVSVVSFSACNFTKFDGSRTGNESQLIMQYDVLNMTDSQKLKLARVIFSVLMLSASREVLIFSFKKARKIRYIKAPIFQPQPFR